MTLWRNNWQGLDSSRAGESGVRGSADRRRWQRAILLVTCCLLLSGCRARHSDAEPAIEFTRLPIADTGGTSRLGTIEGRAIDARPGQRIVLFARSGAWYVQPFANQPFTTIQPDSSWKSQTHLGTEYAALLVGPEYRPPAKIDVLPRGGGDVVAVATEAGEVQMLVPLFWQARWFQLAVGLASLLCLLALYRFRIHRLTGELQARFEERLAERTRIAQELHDTLLQGVLSASMQLYVAVDKLAADSPAKPELSHIQQLMEQVIEEGRNAVQGLRSDRDDSLNLEQAFARVQQELGQQEQIEFRVIVDGPPTPLHPVIRDEVYRIGREALVNAFRHSQARRIEVEVDYDVKHLRVLVRDDGCGIDINVLRSGRDRHWGLSGMRERAERIGARLWVRSRIAAGTEVELSIPRHIAFQTQTSGSPLGRFTRRGYSQKKADLESEAINERSSVHTRLQRRRSSSCA
jgi:signal transduction histidine kinase